MLRLLVCVPHCRGDSNPETDKLDASRFAAALRLIADDIDTFGIFTIKFREYTTAATAIVENETVTITKGLAQ